MRRFSLSDGMKINEERSRRDKVESEKAGRSRVFKGIGQVAMRNRGNDGGGRERAKELEQQVRPGGGERKARGRAAATAAVGGITKKRPENSRKTPTPQSKSGDSGDGTRFSAGKKNFR